MTVATDTAGVLGPPAVSLHDGAQRRGQVGQVAVVHAAVVELVGELAEQSGPVPAGGCGRDAYLDPPFHHLDGG